MASASPDSYEVRETANLAKVMGPDENSYTASAKRIPMPDGVELAGDFYQPDLPAGRKPHGLIYVLCPYGRAGVMTLTNAKAFAGRGYMVLLVSCRGTAGSGSVFVAAMTEQADSQAVVKWMRQQPYMGYVQWALLRDPPEDLVASVNLCSVFGNSLLVWTNGAYRMDRISWSHMVARQDQITSAGCSSILDPMKLMLTMQATPISEAAEKFFEGRASYALDAMKTPNVDDPFWAQAKHRAALEHIKIPLLLRGGWYDTLTVQTMAAYARVRDRGIKVYLTVGSWTQIEACGTNAMPEVFDFLDEYFTGRKKDHRPLSVRVFYLHGDKTIDEQLPAADSPPASFTYDPHNPTPTVGGPLMARGGRVDDSVYTSRPDVLVYTSPPLTQDVKMMGKPVDAQGGMFSLALVDRAHVFKKGTRIRVIVAGGSFPLIARNPGTGVNRTLAEELKAVTHTVQHGSRVSMLILPCSV
ncbi:galactose-binding domain-like protein [Lasiosphaeria miniovina]|uniref:Galactose-binding domain-like protein n=1 Tax=Lasiosphaeria miniovina TaxID=1954250 RepID=A0AA40AC86_9PEZI|nr:galactose-binding domain-like protein [Lasiosphaeria miniovina]KAK0713186.1 galactose-binding domain-like protein [Lasiosphaeria miniovina]